MNSSEFTKSFLFHTFSRHGFHHTDSSHGSTCNYLAMMLEGRSEFVTEGVTLQLSPGEMFFIPRGCRYHSYWYGEESRWHSLAFDVFPNPDGKRYMLQKLPQDAEAADMMQKIAEAGSATCETVAMLYSLLARLISHMKTEEITPQEALIAAASQHLQKNPNAAVPEIARLCNISESGLYAAFRQAGTTPIEVRHRLQIEHALRLLTTTDLTVDAIAEQTGFSSPAYFLRVLKNFTGRTSREIRRGALM